MTYDFDTVIDRKNTLSLKYDFAARRGKPADVLPFWVADMDFQAPPEVLERLRQQVDHGIFGYSETGEAYFEALSGWMQRRLGWAVEKDWLIKTPGVVFAIGMAVRALTRPGEAVLIQQPVYYPFSQCITVNRRKLVVQELTYKDGAYSIDLAEFEQKIVQYGVKLFVLCSPHNPIGRVWTKEELEGMGDICLKHGVQVVSDEIHADFIYPGNTHTVFSSLKKEYQQISVICTAPSKTFNLAGLQISNLFVANPKTRRAIREEIDKTGYSQLNVMGLVACQAAYETGEAWLEALKRYLEKNLAFLRQSLRDITPSIGLVEPEGTYLAWMDFSAWPLQGKALDDWMLHQAKLWLDDGAIFGKGGRGFQRINIACPAATLEKAMHQLQSAAKPWQ